MEHPLPALENLPSRLPKSTQLWLPPFFDGNQTLVCLWFTPLCPGCSHFSKVQCDSSRPFALCTRRCVEDASFMSDLMSKRSNKVTLPLESLFAFPPHRGFDSLDGFPAGRQTICVSSNDVWFWVFRLSFCRSLESMKLLCSPFPSLPLFSGSMTSQLLEIIFILLSTIGLFLSSSLSSSSPFLHMATYFTFIIDSVLVRLFLTEKRVVKILSVLGMVFSHLLEDEGMSARLLPKVLGMFTAISPALVAAKLPSPLRAPLCFKGPKWVWDCLVPPYLSLAFLSFLWYQVEANEGRLFLSPNYLQLLTTDASEPRKMVRSCSRCQKCEKEKRAQV